MMDCCDWVSALQDTQIQGYAKAMYVSDDRRQRPNQNTVGAGGKLGLATGEIAGLSIKAGWYATSDLGMASHNQKEVDSYMFDVNKRPYGLLGEAQIHYRSEHINVTLGRQELHTPMISSGDYRIVPNLFEAYTLKAQASTNTHVTLAYVSKMAGLDGLTSFSQFRSMSEQAYTSLLLNSQGKVDGDGNTADISRIAGNQGVWAVGAVNENAEQGIKSQLWNYYTPEMQNLVYLDGQVKVPIHEQWTFTTDAQTYYASDLGHFRDYLREQGLNARYGFYGLKGTLAYKPSGISVALAQTHFSGNDHTVTSTTSWGAYPEFIIAPYIDADHTGISAMARSHANKLTGLFDLGVWGLPGQSLLLGHARIYLDNSIQPNSNVTANSLIYRAKLTSKLAIRFHVEKRESPHSHYDNSFAAMSVRYDY